MLACRDRPKLEGEVKELNRLAELGTRSGVRSYLIDDAGEIRPEWLVSTSRIGLTAGASAPESLVQEVLERLSHLGVTNVTEMPGEPETTVFRLPEVSQA